VVVSALTTTLGCGQASSGSSIGLDQFSTESVAAVCHKVFTCCTSTEIAAIDPMIVDEASCEARLAPTPSSVLTSAPALVDAGVVVYHGDAARACLDAFAALPCNTWGGPFSSLRLAACAPVFQGTLPAGSTCAVSAECASDYCTNASNGGVACAAPVNLGESCEFAPCTSGLSCVSNQAGGPRTCGHPFPDGSACLYAQDCASGFCSMDPSTGSSTCEPPATCNGL
jgi:hypothetical protein